MLLRYSIRGADVKRILTELAAVTRVRIVFYDVAGAKLEEFAGHSDYAYCRRLRRAAEFDRKCVACDLAHIDRARERRSVEVYHCHHGLMEGIVPLFDAAGVYLGAVGFGQIREPSRVCPAGRRMETLYRELPAYRPVEVRRIAGLLKLLGEYIVQNHLIRLERQDWSRQLQDFIHANLARPPTLAECAAAVGRSGSFLTHNVKQEFGCSLRQYVQLVRMERARDRLAAGERVKAVAHSLGFCDEFHFSRVFKRTFGQAPSRAFQRSTP
jgi:AraC-like DNA-binding protein